MDRKRRMRKNRGFTLIELMVTVAIIGLGMTVVFFQIDVLLPGTRLQAACANLVSDMENLRLAGIMVYKEPIHLEYNLQDHGYRAYLPLELDEEQNVIGPGESELLDFKYLPEGVAFVDITLGAQTQALEDAETVTVLLNPDGSVTGHIVHIGDITENIDQEQDVFSIRVASLTGFAEIMDQRIDYENIDENSF